MTTIQKSNRIDKWIKENNSRIELYNFKTDKISYVKTIEKALDRVIPEVSVNQYNGKYTSTHPKYSLEILGVDKTWYSETIPIDVLSDIEKEIKKIEGK